MTPQDNNTMLTCINRCVRFCSCGIAKQLGYALQLSVIVIDLEVYIQPESLFVHVNQLTNYQPHVDKLHVLHGTSFVGKPEIVLLLLVLRNEETNQPLPFLASAANCEAHPCYQRKPPKEWDSFTSRGSPHQMGGRRV